MIDLQNVKDAFMSFEVNDVVFIRFGFHITCGLTKTKHNSAVIDALKAANISHLIEQWIVRYKMDEVSVERRGGVSN